VDVIVLHGRAMLEFDARVRAVPADRWHAPTPCIDWDVRTLVNHVVYEQLWTAPLLAGRTVDDVGDAFDGDVLGDDPVGAWERSSEAARAAWIAPGAVDRTVHLSFGPTPAVVYAEQSALDLAVHAWDLARGIGADDRLADDVVTGLDGVVRGQADMIAASGVFSPPVPVEGSADPQTRVLALLGRRR
jgi:uncharacterized protein (TIGR03086 family)